MAIQECLPRDCRNVRGISYVLTYLSENHGNAPVVTTTNRQAHVDLCADISDATSSEAEEEVDAVFVDDVTYIVDEVFETTRGTRGRACMD